MTTLRQQLFQEFAQVGLDETLAEFRRKYQVKKGERFNCKGITYEIGPAVLAEGGIEFEISSKIPQDELTKNMTQDAYFKEVKKLVSGKKKKPHAIEKENIVREMGGDEVKERDYVKLTYLFQEKELFNSKEIAKRASSIDAKEAQSIEEIPGVQTIAGRLVLTAIRDCLRDASKETMEHLIEANEKVRQKIKKPKKKT